MHVPVLLHETVDALQVGKKKGTCVYVDCTVNRGGHSELLLSQMKKDDTLICIDLDNTALEEAKEKLSPIAPQKGVTLHFISRNFREIKDVLVSYGIEKVDGLIADLGISSQELDSSHRGFSFRYDEPLQMTLKDNPNEDDVTAEYIVNNWDYEMLVTIFEAFSDERFARQIARKIVAEREVSPIRTTYELVNVVKKAVPMRFHFGKTHVATKTFQAIRMAVNDELGAVTDLVQALPEILHEGARASVITFHSTEDRIVKHTVRSLSEELDFVNRKAILPSDAEVTKNPRARSAQLRIIEKIKK